VNGSHHNWISVTAWNNKYPLLNTETVVGALVGNAFITFGGPVKSNLEIL
ncbi:17805_t:CDS:2, partial [Gigaspora rosea]